MFAASASKHMIYVVSELARQKRKAAALRLTPHPVVQRGTILSPKGPKVRGLEVVHLGPAIPP